MRYFVSAVAVVAVLYLALAGLIVLFQSSLMYFPTNTDPERRGRPPFRAWLNEKGGLLAYVRDGGSEVRRVIVMFHGNGGEALHRAWLHDLAPAEDVVLVLAEYPGYGSKEGKPSEKALIESGRQVLAAVRKTWTAPITLVGESLGTGVASALSREEGIDRLALISPFTSALDVAKISFSFLPLRLLMRDQFDSVSALKQTRLPLHIIHGTADDIVPFALGQALFESYQGEDKTFTALEGVGHNDIVAPVLTLPEAEAFRRFVGNS